MTLQKILKLLASSNEEDIKIGNELLEAHPQYITPVAALIFCCGQSPGIEADQPFDEALGESAENLWSSGCRQSILPIFSATNVPNIIKHILENAKQRKIPGSHGNLVSSVRNSL